MRSAESRGVHRKREDMRARWRECVAWRRGGASSAQGGPSCGCCWQGTRGAHLKHVLHVCDAGGVEAQRLVERRRALPSREGCIGRGATWGLAKRRAWGGRGASSAQGGPSCGGCWRGTRGAHLEHGVHVSDAGRVEAQRLVQRRRALPSRKGCTKSYKKKGDMRARWRKCVGKL